MNYFEAKLTKNRSDKYDILLVKGYELTKGDEEKEIKNYIKDFIKHNYSYIGLKDLSIEIKSITKETFRVMRVNNPIIFVKP